MRRLFPALVMVFATASLLISLLGDSGVMAFARLSAYRQELAANVADLQARNAALAARLEAVRADPETAKVMSRAQGLYEPGETVVKLEGHPSPPEVTVVGDLLRYRAPPAGHNALIKTLAAAAAGAFMLWSIFRMRKERKRTDAAAGR